MKLTSFFLELEKIAKSFKVKERINMKNKYKNKTKEWILIPPEDIPKKLYKRLKKYSTVKINSDNVKLLINYPPFIKRITSLRNSFSIPKLSRQKDSIKTKNPPLTRMKPRNLSVLSCNFFPDPQSKWFNSLSVQQQNRLANEIDQILQAFNLPLTFDWRTWLIFYLLYNKKTLYLPLYNFDPIVPFSKAPLTTNEKRALRQIIKFRKKGDFGLDNSKELLRKILNEYSKALKTKNKLRPLKSIDRSIRVTKEMKRRKRKSKKIYSGYLKIIKDGAKKEKYYKDILPKLEKMHPSDIEKILDIYSSKDIANKIFKDKNKDALVRKIAECFKKVQTKRFSEKNKT